MTDIIIERDGYDFEAALKQAKTRLEYYQESISLEVARRISNVMQERGVSRSDLARDLNVSPAYITKVLRGDENFSIQTLARIAFVLKMKWECLLIDRDAFLGPYCLMNETKPKMTAIETTTIETSSSISLNNEDYEVMKENHDPIPA